MRTSYNGTVEGTYTSLPFGDGYAFTGSDSDPYHVAQLDSDTETGSDHAQFRQYSSAQGRWMSTDPYDGSYDFSNPQSFNRYSYALNNPLSYVDPLGLYATQPVQCGTDEDGNPVFCMGAGNGDGGDGGDGDGGGGVPPQPFSPVPTDGGGGDGTAPKKPHTQCPPGTYADTSGTPDYQGGATEYGVNADGSPTKFAGRRTASGSIFDPWGYTATTIQGPPGARWTIPKNTFLNVVSTNNPAANVVVQITDTGILGPGDVIDLSAGAMKTLTGKAFNSVPVKIYTCRAR